MQSSVSKFRQIKKTPDNFNYETQDWKKKITLPKEDQRKKTTDVTKTHSDNWDAFALKKPLIRALLEIGFEKPSPVQEDAIPTILQGNHVLARAKNGTGKTGAYSIPILQKISNMPDKSKRPKNILSLILVPTRELALQTHSVIKKFSKYLDIRTMCATGGTSIRTNILHLNNRIDVLVGTPGRILDLAQSGKARLGNCTLICCDEADKLLSTDFQLLVSKILGYTNNINRQIMLFSATFPSSVKSFCDKWLPKNIQLNLMDELTLKGITQYYCYVSEKDKVHCLYTLMKKLKIDQCIIFCRAVNRVELLARKINKLSFSCFYIHSKMSQHDRSRYINGMFDHDCGSLYLVCTDLFTRGIDIQTVNVVINFDFPKAAETYLHRIGRAGRFGHLALAINFICESDRNNLYDLEKKLGTEINPIPKEIDTALYAQ